MEKRNFSSKNQKRSSNKKKFEPTSEKIQTNMYQYMLDNYEKVMFWIKQLAKTPTCQEKFLTLSENSYMNEEDLVQETYARILKTFYDNEQRLIRCKNCRNQCQEFITKTKRKNTKNYSDGEECKPYKYYSYTEKEFNNYINRALKQNIDIKLKKLSKNGQRLVLKTEEKLGGSEDSCELGALLADLAELKKDSIRDLTENFLGKKLIFINKLDDFELLSDPYEQKEESIELPNENYDELNERQKEYRRSFYTKAGISIPDSLRPEPKTIIYNVGKPIVDIERELNSRFDFLNSYVETDEFWRKVLLKAEKDDVVKIGTQYSSAIRSKLEGIYSVNLDHVLTDEDIKNSFMNRGETKESVEKAELYAKMDMMECLPDFEELNSYSSEDLNNYLIYEEDWDNLYEPEMIYGKNTEIRIVDKDYKIIPLPLCTYAEISIRDFLEFSDDYKKNGSNFISRTSAKSDYINSFKEIWIDFEHRSYNIRESYQYEPKRIRFALYRLTEKAKRLQNKQVDPQMKEVMKAFAEESFIEEKLSSDFIKRVLVRIKEEASSIGYSSYINSKKITLPIARKVRLTESERIQRAKAQYENILKMKDKIRDNSIEDIDTSNADTLIPNLTPKELFSSLLEKIPVQETVYRKEEVKVLCTEIAESLRTVSI